MKIEKTSRKNNKTMSEQTKTRAAPKKWGADDDSVILADLKNKVTTEDIAKKLNRTPGAIRIRINKIITNKHKSGATFETICEEVAVTPKEIEKAIDIFNTKKEKQKARQEERKAEKAEKMEKMKDVEHVKNRLNELQTQLIDIITEIKEINKLVNKPQ